jgi:hypothetical protein
MRRSTSLSWLLVIFACLLSACSHTPVIPLPPTGPQLVQQISGQTVALVDEQSKDQQPFCTGVWISPTVILTAQHCVEGYADHVNQLALYKELVKGGLPEMLAQLLAQADFADDDQSEAAQIVHSVKATLLIVKPKGLHLYYTVQAEVGDPGEAPQSIHLGVASYLDKKADLALIDTQGFVPPHDVAHLAVNVPPVGEDVSTIGQTHGLWYDFKRMTVSAYRGTMAHTPAKSLGIDGPFMQVSGLMTGGDSGGGDFDRFGYLVGINSFASESAHVGYCIHLQTIRNFLGGQKMAAVPLNVQTADPSLANAPLNLE